MTDPEPILPDRDEADDLSSAGSLTGGRGWMLWYGVNVLAMAVHVWLSKPLWAYHLEPGQIHAGGPGDGLYFFFFLLIPWGIFMLVNIIVLLTRRRASMKRNTVLFALVIAWLIIAIVEQRSMQIPEGVIRIT